MTKAQLWKSPVNLCQDPVIHEDTWDVSGGFSRNLISLCDIQKKRGRAFCSVCTSIVSPERELLIRADHLDSGDDFKLRVEFPKVVPRVWNVEVSCVHGVTVWTFVGLNSPCANAGEFICNTSYMCLEVLQSLNLEVTKWPDSFSFSSRHVTSNAS